MTEWVELGTATMRDARKRLGFSYETVARQLHVSSKTYERYEKRGAVPRHLLTATGQTLDLEIVMDHAAPVHVIERDEAPDFAAQLALIEQRLGRLEAGIQALLDADRERQAVRQAGGVP